MWQGKQTHMFVGDVCYGIWAVGLHAGRGHRWPAILHVMVSSRADFLSRGVH